MLQYSTITKSFEDKPNAPGFKVRSAYPHNGGYKWDLVHESIYDLVFQLGLYYDIKTIGAAKKYLSKIDEEIVSLQGKKDHLSELLKGY